MPPQQHSMACSSVRLLLLALMLASVPAMPNKAFAGIIHGAGGPPAEAMLRAQKTPALLPKGAGKKDVTVREGLGENLPYGGIGFLGTGYDMVKGNPDGDSQTMVDPGFRPPILELVYDQDKTLSKDVKWLVPGGAFVHDEPACYRSDSSSDVSSQSAYQAALEVDASQKVEASIKASFIEKAFSFAGSRLMQEQRETEAEQDSVKIELKSYCLLWHAGFATPNYVMRDLDDDDMVGMSHVTEKTVPIPFALGFDESVNRLDDNNEEEWMNFFTTYGTHMVDELHLGGKVRHLSKTTRTMYDELKKNGQDIGRIIETMYGGSINGVGIKNIGQSSTSSNSRENAGAHSIDSAKVRTTTTVKGGLPPSAGIDTTEGWSQWAATLKDHPMPVKYSLVPLTRVHRKLRELQDTYWQMYESYAKYVVAEVKSTEKKRTRASIAEIEDITYVDAVMSGVYIRDKRGVIWKQSNAARGLWEEMVGWETKLQTFELSPDGAFGVGLDSLRHTWTYHHGQWSQTSSTPVNFATIQPSRSRPLIYATNQLYQGLPGIPGRAGWQPADRGTKWQGTKGTDPNKEYADAAATSRGWHQKSWFKYRKECDAPNKIGGGTCS